MPNPQILSETKFLSTLAVECSATKLKRILEAKFMAKDNLLKIK